LNIYFPKTAVCVVMSRPRPVSGYWHRLVAAIPLFEQLAQRL
jgi:hypothetical protein